MIRLERLPKPIKIARLCHYCASCGALIKKGDKMTMRMYGGSFPRPICVKCDGRFPEDNRR